MCLHVSDANTMLEVDNGTIAMQRDDLENLVAHVQQLRNAADSREQHSQFKKPDASANH